MFNYAYFNFKGGREILRHYGYKVDIPDGVAFPDGQEPDPNKVAMVTSDILVAREEIQLYTEGRHPRPEPFEKHLPMNARFIVVSLIDFHGLVYCVPTYKKSLSGF